MSPRSLGTLPERLSGQENRLENLVQTVRDSRIESVSPNPAIRCLEGPEKRPCPDPEDQQREIPGRGCFKT